MMLSWQVTHPMFRIPSIAGCPPGSGIREHIESIMKRFTFWLSVEGTTASTLFSKEATGVSRHYTTINEQNKFAPEIHCL
jgi:hypothetical protein